MFRYHNDLLLQPSSAALVFTFYCLLHFNHFWFQVFDIVLNGDHTIVSDLDIYDRVGRGVAHDEYVPFSVLNDKLFVNGAESDIQSGMIRVEFIKVCLKYWHTVGTPQIKIMYLAWIQTVKHLNFFTCRATETILKLMHCM